MKLERRKHRSCNCYQPRYERQAVTRGICEPLVEAKCQCGLVRYFLRSEWRAMKTVHAQRNVS
jgi:hypothetical protein